MTFVKTLSASVAAGDDEAVQAVREHVRHVAIQAINNGLYAARKEIKVDLQISKLSSAWLPPVYKRCAPETSRRPSCPTSSETTSFIETRCMPNASVEEEDRPMHYVQSISRTTRLVCEERMP